MSAINLSRALCNCHTLYFGQHYQDLFVTGSPSPGRVSCVMGLAACHQAGTANVKCEMSRHTCVYSSISQSLAGRSHIVMIEVFLNMYMIRQTVLESFTLHNALSRPVGH